MRVCAHFSHVAAEAAAITHVGGAFGAARAVGKHGADIGRLPRTHGLHAAAAGCRRRQECQGQSACECSHCIPALAFGPWYWVIGV